MAETGPGPVDLRSITAGAKERGASAMESVIAPRGSERFRKFWESGYGEKLKQLRKNTWDTFWTSEQLKTNAGIFIATAGLRASVTLGTGGLDLAGQAVLGAGIGAAIAAFKERKFVEKEKRNYTKAILRGAAFGAVGAGAGVYIRESGISDWVAGKAGEFISRHDKGRLITVGVEAAAGGALGKLVQRFRKGSGIKAILIGAAIGAVAGEITDTGVFDSVSQISPVRPTVPREPAVIPTLAPPLREASPIPTRTPITIPTEGPRVPPTLPVEPTRIPGVLPPPKISLDQGLPVGVGAFMSEPQDLSTGASEQFLKAGFIDSGSGKDFMIATPDVLDKTVSSLRFTDELKGKVMEALAEVKTSEGREDLIKIMQEGVKLSSLEGPLTGDADIPLHMKGKLEFYLGEWMAANPMDPDVDSFLSNINDDEAKRALFFNAEKAINEIKSGQFDWQNADHARLIHMFDEEGAGKKMLYISYFEEKYLNNDYMGMPKSIFQSGNSDLFRAGDDPAVPRGLNDYSENGWFTKIKNLK